jgi:colicin import membrane protein
MAVASEEGKVYDSSYSYDGSATVSAVLTISPVGSDVRDRIIEVADSLYEQSGHQSIPTVHQVRQAARADMNAVSIVMREWRMALTARAAPTPVQVPDALAAVHIQGLATLWTQAQELASESLQAAQVKWEEEKAASETIRQQMVSDFATLEAELEQLRADNLAAVQAQQRAAAELASVRAEAALALTRAERAEAQAGEIDRRANDLATELARAHEEANAERERHAGELTRVIEQSRADLASVKAIAETEAHRQMEQRKQAVEEIQRLVERMATTEADRDQAHNVAVQAREQAARLQGHIEALQTQHTELLRAVSGLGVNRPSDPA